MAAHYPRGKHFVRKAFHQFFTKDTIAWFSERGVQVKTEADGRMFPVSDQSSTVIDCLLREANLYGVEIRTRSEVRQSSVQENDNGQGPFTVTLRDGRVLRAKYVCVAAGGYAKSESFDWLRSLGHDIEEPVPSLFTLNAPKHRITALMGVAVPDAVLRFRGTKLEERGPILITHWGLSGPAVLRLSAWGARSLHAMSYTGEAVINWVPSCHEASMRARLLQEKQDRARLSMDAKNPFGLPQRLWEFLLSDTAINGKLRWCDVPNKELNRLSSALCAYVLPVQGKTTFKEEFVTAGGINTAEVNPQHMESRKQPGLYFAGEILDVDGITGGYNFQHAWTSGYLAAASMAAREHNA
jgi:predicted Rossmann fold flavoprotein